MTLIDTKYPIGLVLLLTTIKSKQILGIILLMENLKNIKINAMEELQDKTQTIYQFTKVAEVEATPVRDQGETGACWAFATISFLESELKRKGIGTFDLSEMFVVRHEYAEKIKDYYLRQGRGHIGQGAMPHRVLEIIAKYGITLASDYPGMPLNYKKHDHTELFAYYEALAYAAVELKRYSAEFHSLLQDLLDIYLGDKYRTFVLNNRNTTPKAYASLIGLTDLNDYIEITSFLHHPFYTRFPLEIVSNWNNQPLYNVPLNDLMAIIDTALLNGYSFVWGGSQTEAFNHNMGIAIEPLEKDIEDALKLKKIYPEEYVSQELRQTNYETYITEDDHMLHVTGLYKDQNGCTFYKCKNSWGTKLNEDMGGYLYMSKAYMQMRTMYILIHKEAIPTPLYIKMNL